MWASSTSKRVWSSSRTPPPWSLTLYSATRPGRTPPSCSSYPGSPAAPRPSRRLFSTTFPPSNAPNPHLTTLLRPLNPSSPSSPAPERPAFLRSPYKLSLYATPNHTMLTLSTQASVISRSLDPLHQPTREELNQSLTVLTLTTRMHATSRLPKGSRKSDLGRTLGVHGVQDQAEEISGLMLQKVNQLLETPVQVVVDNHPNPNKKVPSENESAGIDPRLIGSTRYPWPRPTSIKMEYRGRGPGKKAFYNVFTGEQGKGLSELIEGVQDELPKGQSPPPKKRIQILQEKEAKRIKEKKEFEQFMASKSKKGEIKDE